MNLPESLNSYIIAYRTIADSGVIDFSNKKIKIESKTEQNAIEVLRNKLRLDNGSSIRIDKIEQVNIKKEPEKKRKGSPCVWMVGGLFVLAGSANLLTKLF